MKKTKEVEEFECDGCGNRYMVEPGEEMPLGFHIPSVFWIHGGGGTGADDVFACKASCLKKAIENALTRQW